MEREYRKPKYDPYEIFKPSKSFLLQIIKDLKQECYATIKEKEKTKAFPEAFRQWCTEHDDARLKKINGRIRDLQYRIRHGSEASNDRPGRITDSDIQTAKEVQLTSLYQGTLRGGRLRLLGKCPFHPDKTASLTIYVEQNTWWCYGCSEGGSSVDYVMKSNKLNFIESVKYLTQK